MTQILETSRASQICFSRNILRVISHLPGGEADALVSPQNRCERTLNATQCRLNQSLFLHILLAIMHTTFLPISIGTLHSSSSAEARSLIKGAWASCSVSRPPGPVCRLHLSQQRRSKSTVLSTGNYYKGSFACSEASRPRTLRHGYALPYSQRGLHVDMGRNASLLHVRIYLQMTIHTNDSFYVQILWRNCWTDHVLFP